MKNFYLIFLFSILSTNLIFAGRCTGSDNCSACSTCSSCKYCNSGGSCGVCGGAGGFGKVLLTGVGIFILLSFFGDNSNKRK